MNTGTPRTPIRPRPRHHTPSTPSRRRRKRRLWPLALALVFLFGFSLLLYGLISHLAGGAQAANGGPAAANAAPPALGDMPYIVALDAGHGGDDIGAEGIIREVELTEATVQHLYELLAANASFSPVLTRQAGETMKIPQRVARAQELGASLLLSVHGNSDPVYNSSGFECFPKPPGRAGHDESLRFATLLAQEMVAAGSGTRGENGVRYIYYMPRADGSTEKMYREVSDTATYPEQSFGILEGASCPAVLAEQCYITNTADVEAFGNEAGCKKAAECYYRAICAYFNVAE